MYVCNTPFNRCTDVSLYKESKIPTPIDWGYCISDLQ